MSDIAAMVDSNSNRRAPPAPAHGAGHTIDNGHAPVMRDEVVARLRPRDGGVYVDATFGAGGYTRALLESASCMVWGIDRDTRAVRRGQLLAQRYPGRLVIIHGRFGDMPRLLAERGVDKVDGVVLDLGVSSMQIDDATRGFSFRAAGPLDMRMDEFDETGPTAADLVNCWSEQELADIIHAYGEERQARRIARAIVRARAEAPIATTERLADLVRGVVRARAGDIDAATRTFQALRIKVNDELGELERGLGAAERMLRPGGRLAVASFHSLEDRRVKTFLRTRSGAAPGPSRHLPNSLSRQPPSFRLLDRKAARPSGAEIQRNPRARSARLRAAERTEAPPFPPERAP